MGYTHYWSFNFKAGKADELENKYQQAILECQKLIYKTAESNRKLYHSSFFSGYTAHTKPGKYAGLLLNGTGANACEDFIMREHFKQNDPQGFCKTNRNAYYDLLTQACLLILKYRLGDAMTVTSDGSHEEWLPAREIARLAIRRQVKIPETIRTYSTSLKEVSNG